MNDSNFGSTTHFNRTDFNEQMEEERRYLDLIPEILYETKATYWAYRARCRCEDVVKGDDIRLFETREKAVRSQIRHLLDTVAANDREALEGVIKLEYLYDAIFNNHDSIHQEMESFHPDALDQLHDRLSYLLIHPEVFKVELQG